MRTLAQRNNKADICSSGNIMVAGLSIGHSRVLGKRSRHILITLYWFMIISSFGMNLVRQLDNKEKTKRKVAFSSPI